MKILKRIYILLLSAVLICGGSGCELNNSEIVKEEQAAHDEWLRWRKEFLAEQELPTEYSELSSRQQTAVKRIYEMLMYLEDKYGITFKYTGYVEPQILEIEHLTAIPEGGNEKTDTVTVTCEDDGTFTDDYPNVVVRPYYEQMITDYVKDYFGSDKVRVFSTVTETTIDDFNNISEEKMKGNIYSKNIIFININLGTKESIKKFAENYCLWLKENDISCDSQIMLLYNPNISLINRENYSDYFGKEHIELRLICYVEKNGEIQISEREVR